MTPTNAPALDTARVALRPVRVEDAGALHRHWTDPDVRRYLWDGRAVSLAQVEEVVAESERLFAELGYGLWALRPRGSGDLFGCAGYWLFHEPPRLELVVSLDPAWWGRGLATEAGAALMAHGFDALGMAEVQASTDAANAASQRLVERLGLLLTHRREAEGLDTAFYAVTAAAWRRPPGDTSRRGGAKQPEA